MKKVEEKKKGSNFSFFLILLKKVINVRTLLPLVVILSFNTYAWFLFSTKVETGINAKVRAWNILFETKDQQVVEHLQFDIDEVYPGMTTYTDYATVNNKGDGEASLQFSLESMTILGDRYVADGTTYTSDDLLDMLSNDYPFKVSLTLTNDTIAPGEEESFRIEVSWAFESGDDALDTEWGIKAYDYNKSHPDSPSIQLDVLLEVDQTTE